MAITGKWHGCHFKNVAWMCQHQKIKVNFKFIFLIHLLVFYGCYVGNNSVLGAFRCQSSCHNKNFDQKCSVLSVLSEKVLLAHHLKVKLLFKPPVQLLIKWHQKVLSLCRLTNQFLVSLGGRQQKNNKLNRKLFSTNTST